MDKITAVSSFACPHCKTQLETPSGVESYCPRCQWTGTAHLFHAIPVTAQRAEEALPDDATCTHHPAKMAVTVCEGTGDFVCALCHVELDGRSYSIQYLDKGGRDKAAKAFDRYLNRPDRAGRSYAVLGCALFFIPVVCFIPMIVSLVRLVQAPGARARDPVLAKASSGLQIVAGWLLFVAVLAFLIFYHVALFMNDWRFF